MSDTSRIALKRRGLLDLRDVPLGARAEAMLQFAGQTCRHANAVERTRLLAEARDLLAAEQLAGSGRLHVQGLDLRDGLRAIVTMPDVPVPCLAESGNDLEIRYGATLGFLWPRELIWQSVKGIGLAHVLDRPVWHPNSSIADKTLPSVICLGVSVMRGTPLVAGIVVPTYAMLTMQTPPSLTLLDPAGIVNPAAVPVYQAWVASNQHRLPLSRVPFLQAGAANGDAA